MAEVSKQALVHLEQQDKDLLEVTEDILEVLL
jgi:hypothetical protein